MKKKTDAEEQIPRQGYLHISAEDLNTPGNLVLDDAEWRKRFLCWSPQKRCPVHGIVDHTITCSIPGYQMQLCQICYIETLVKLGVHKLEDVKDTET